MGTVSKNQQHRAFFTVAATKHWTFTANLQNIFERSTRIEQESALLIRMISDNAKIGTGLLALGIGFLFLGMLFLFDSAMLALGDVLFLLGLTMTIGTWMRSRIVRGSDSIGSLLTGRSTLPFHACSLQARVELCVFSRGRTVYAALFHSLVESCL